MVKKRKNTFWYRIGKSNWYRRYQAGKLIKRQFSRVKVSRSNRVISRHRKIKRKPRIKLLTSRIFFNEIPRQSVFSLYDDKKDLLLKFDLTKHNFWVKIKDLVFNGFFNDVAGSHLILAKKLFYRII